MSLFVVFVGLVAKSASAEEKRFGDWSVGVVGESDGIYAGTVNDSGGVFGQYCSASEASCIWVLSNSIEGEDGGKYPVLINTSTGAASTVVMCKRVDGKARYVFTNFTDVERIVDGATWVGIAFPMKNGLFKVSRFSLDGQARAVAFMEKVVKSLPASTTRNTSDQVY